jgi:gluconate 5-dehydrogenase
MAKELTGVHAVITGGSSGLGYAMVEALLDEGATVAVASRPGAKMTEAVNNLQNKGYSNVFELPLDVRSEGSVQDAVNWVKTEWGKIDVLVNNAGIGMRTVNPKFLTEPQPFYQVSPEGFRNLIDTNVHRVPVIYHG